MTPNKTGFCSFPPKIWDYDYFNKVTKGVSNSFFSIMPEHKKLRHTLELKTMREQKPPFDFMDTGYKGQGFPVYS